MHTLFEINSGRGVHPVQVFYRNLREVIDTTNATLIIADRCFCDTLESIGRPVVYIEATESAKDLACMPSLIRACRDQGLTREGHIWAVGGGVIQDIACFIASTYMRGVGWTYLPTTLLAMVDSCIGGKSSINVGDHKNLVGTFYPPNAVLIVPATLATLSADHIVAGRAEAAKICFARGERAFERFCELDKEGFSGNPSALIEHSLRAKKWFIEIDEFDQAERLLLNFGHSFGHALESCSEFSVPHGIAVGIGCLAAVALSVSCDPRLDEHPRVRRIQAQLLAMLRPLRGLAGQLAMIDRERFICNWNGDKKHSGSVYRPILINSEAQLYRASLPRDVAIADLIWASFCSARDQLGGDSPEFS